MKLIHTADLHIGKIIYEISMISDQEYILKQIEKIIEEEKADGLIIAGDIYDRAIPCAQAVTVLDNFLTNLINKGKQIFLISGNHDSPERINFASRILEKKGLYIAGCYEKEIKKITIQDKYGKIHFYLLPFAKIAVFYALKEKTIESYNACIKEVIEEMNINTKERNVLIAHCFVTNGKINPDYSGSEGSFFVGGIENADAKNFLDFDYVALGHIHRPQKVKADFIRYSGSPLKYSFSEVSQTKTVSVIELLEKGTIYIKERELVPLHDMKRVEGKLCNLLKEETIGNIDKTDYIQAVVTDKERLFDPMQKLRSVYPNILNLVLKTENKETKETENNLIQIKEKTMMEICERFFEDITEIKLDKNRRELLKNLIEKIERGEIENEADLVNN